MKVRLSWETSRTITVDVKTLVREYPDEAYEFGLEIDEETGQLVYNQKPPSDSIDQFVLDAHANGVFDSGDYHSQWEETDDVGILYGDE